MGLRKIVLVIALAALVIIVGWSALKGVSVELVVVGGTLGLGLIWLGPGWSYFGRVHRSQAADFVDQVAARIIESLGNEGNLPLLGSRLELILDAVSAEMELWERAETAAFGIMMVRQGTVFGSAIPADYLKGEALDLAEFANNPRALATALLAAEVFGRLAVAGDYQPDEAGQPAKSHVALIYESRRNMRYEVAFPPADARFHHIRP